MIDVVLKKCRCGISFVKKHVYLKFWREKKSLLTTPVE